MKFRDLVVITVFFCLFSSVSSAAIYQWVDDSGQTHFTDDPKKIPEKFKEKAVDFDKVEHKGRVTFDPTPVSAPGKQAGEEPSLKSAPKEDDQQAKAAKQHKVILYMADW